jgi:hypothetical protein
VRGLRDEGPVCGVHLAVLEEVAVHDTREKALRGRRGTEADCTHVLLVELAYGPAGEYARRLGTRLRPQLGVAERLRIGAYRLGCLLAEPSR